MSRNPKTGLIEELDPYYGVAKVYQRGLGSLRFTGQRRAVHRIPIGNGKTLDCYADLGASDELIVGFHGANSKERNFYPRFERVRSLRSLVPAFINFADPTMQLENGSGMLLSWYLGGPGWDPLFEISKVIRKAMGKSGAKHVAFVGGSGGGYAALRASTLFPGSLAYVQEPQTSLALYIPSVVEKYFQTVWPGWNQKSLLEAFPERFDMNELYRVSSPNNFVYYTQSRADVSHVRDHFEPFCSSVGVSTEGGNNSTQTRTLKLYDGEVAGHGRMTSREFTLHFNEAVNIWRQIR